MPNHVMNNVHIRGEKEVIKEIANKILNVADADGNVKEFTFNAIIPQPKGLNIEESTRVMECSNYIKENKPLDEFSEDIIAIARQRLENIKKYGVPSWYEWNLQNWGTKWDAYEESYSYSDNSIFINFLSAWSTPQAVFEKLAEEYPEVSIEVEFADEDLGNNCGTYTFEDGMFNAEDGDYEFACDVWGYD